MTTPTDVAVVQMVAEVWTDLARSLYYRAADLEQQSLRLRQSWTGPSADGYQLMISGLIEGLLAIADLARLVAECLFSLLESLMTAPNAVGMADTYTAVAESLPPAPQAALPPAAPAVLSGEYAQQPPVPAQLFSGLYSNGLATAKAALGGKFAGAVPDLVGTQAVPAAAAPVVAQQRPSGMGGFFMPPMMPPMGMMGGGESGSGRPVPTWLTEPEPEEVFGVPLSNVDPVIDR